MEFGDRGADVQALQRALLSRGYALPRYGADGDFGNETVRALERFCSDERITWRQHDVPPEVFEVLELVLVDEVTLDESLSPPDPPDIGDVKLYDLRHEQSDPHPKSKKARHGHTVRRLASEIDSIVIHQTGVPFSPPKGDKTELGLARRALNVACHAMAFRAGFVVWPVDPLWYIHHADRLNARSLGLEIEGNYPGLRNRKVASGTPTVLTDETVMAARAGMKLLLEAGRALGCPIKYIYAHRQSDSWRRADPGEGLWKAVVLEYAVPVLGLQTRPAERIKHPKGRARDGYPIPMRWDPNGVGNY